MRCSETAPIRQGSLCAANDEQDDEDHQNQAYTAGGKITPMFRIRPCRQTADESQNQYDEQNSVKHSSSPQL
jgi:hypothetical protein